ncbi:MAG: Holliday junction branch migration protein RuvA [Desulfobulbus sp.]|jgi:Holliday junction DNA helicase RuvA|nr:Holliday junction branch migration protein RuvA [Desulfobulbus sp.]
MIASLNGLILAKTPATVILDVNGVGYEVFISSRTYDTLPAAGSPCFLHVHTVVREDAITLYGFGRPEEKELFLLLVTVSGIGPKLAQTILSGIGVADLRQAIMLKDLARLTALSGVGKKTAQRICVELGEKVGTLDGSLPEEGRPEAPAAAGGSPLVDAASALVNLGYPQSTAWDALRVAQQQSEEPDALRVEDLIRLALRSLAAR